MAIAFEASYPGTPLAVRALRRELAALGNDCGMDAEGIAAVRLAVTPAATNAVIVIGDTGRGLAEKRDSPGLGAGLAIIASVAQALKIVSDARGTQIHMGFPCPNAG
jgi:hypothetical protein